MDKQYSVQFFTKFVEAMQKFCRDYIEFEQAVELSGYLSLEIDNYKKERYVLSEMVHSTGDVISESYCVKAFKTMKRLPVIRDHTNTLRLSQDDSIDLRDSPPQYGIPYQTTSSRQRTHIHQTSPNRHNISSQQSYRQTMNRRHNPPSFASGGQNSNAFTTSSSSSAQLEEPSTIQPRQSVQYLTSASHSSPVMALVPSLDDVEADHSSGTSNMNPLVSSADNIQSDESRGQKRSTVQEETSPNKKEKLDNELESLFSAATSIVTVSEGNVDFSTTVGEKVPQSQDVNLDIPNSDQSTSQSHSVSESLRLPESIQIKEEVDPDIMFIDSPGDRSGSEPGGYGADAQSFTSSAEAASSDPKSLQVDVLETEENESDTGSIHDDCGHDKTPNEPSATSLVKSTTKPLHKSSSSFRCTVPRCGYKTNKKYNLQRHMCIHGQKTLKFKCPKCDDCFHSQYEVEQHERGIHLGGILCESCGMEYRSRQGLELHRKTKHQQQGLKCFLCAKVFSNKGLLAGHVNGHMQLKPYQCATCKRSFQYATSRYIHQKRCNGGDRGGERSHLCSDCGMFFKTETALKDHRDAKHSEHLYICGCGKQYKWRPSFVRHRRTCSKAE
ncbi:zinc finger protein 2-like isoform X1 [Gigantopelta aegis]|uniref:zinc finger protein 2-like isoform X1 n=1 Tax=Gigantopelta aegis TaxID=1735272 RepID=UPI001B8881F3|nr:zinc finger protein 2-like isoform X1 [Gigantopelta aegis]